MRKKKIINHYVKLKIEIYLKWVFDVMWMSVSNEFETQS